MSKLTKPLFLIMAIMISAVVFFSSCSFRPSIFLNSKYDYTNLEVNLGKKIESDPTEYLDFSKLSKEDVVFVRKNVQIEFDGKIIKKPVLPEIGRHKLRILYCDSQYREFAVTIADKEPPVFTKAEDIYTFVGLSVDESIKEMFKAKDNSGKAKIKIESDAVNTDSAGKYKVKAVATDPSGNRSEKSAFVFVEAPDNGAYGTYVYISISGQTLTYFVDGRAVLHCPVVTGNPWAGLPTPTGTYYLNYKSQNVTLKGLENDGTKYESFVNYWMSFLGDDYGMHDATWRSSFSGGIYLGGGSHGCVNMPYSYAQSLYGMISPGTPVMIY